MAESGKNEKQFFQFFSPYFYMHRLANEPKPSRPVYILFRMMHLCQGLHYAAKIYQQIWVAIFAKDVISRENQWWSREMSAVYWG